jgi:hypothetical protein
MSFGRRVATPSQRVATLENSRARVQSDRYRSLATPPRPRARAMSPNAAATRVGSASSSAASSRATISCSQLKFSATSYSFCLALRFEFRHADSKTTSANLSAPNTLSSVDCFGVSSQFFPRRDFFAHYPNESDRQYLCSHEFTCDGPNGRAAKFAGDVAMNAIPVHSQTAAHRSRYCVKLVSVRPTVSRQRRQPVPC